MIVDVLYFAGCPNAGPAIDLVRDVLDETGIAAEIRHIQVADREAALRERFLGSPSVRVNGLDVEPAAEATAHYGMMCRVYRSRDGISGIPHRTLIEKAIRLARVMDGSPHDE